MRRGSSGLRLCGDQCLKGATCSNHGNSSIDIYVWAGQAWRNALSTNIFGPPFLSFDWFGTNAFKAMVLEISGADKECPKRRMFIRAYGSFSAGRRPCDVIVRWNGTKFIYEPLVRD